MKSNVILPTDIYLGTTSLKNRGIFIKDSVF